MLIVGGGIIGCSVAYHLTLRGWTDVVLLERHTLTSGTTWHAAGLVGQVRATHNMTRLASYSAELYEQLEADGRGDEVPDAGFEIQVAGRRVASTVSYRAFYDPTNSRIRA